MAEDMKKNIIIITSSIVALFIFTWICVKFIDNDVYPDLSNKNNNVKVDVIKGNKDENVTLNDKRYVVRFNIVATSIKDKNENTKEGYYRDAIIYKLYLNDNEVKNINIEDSSERVQDKMEVNETTKVIKGSDNKDYLLVKIITHSNFGSTIENMLIINENGELLFNHIHEISSIFYKVEGQLSQNYIIGSNNCEDFKYIDTGEELCKNFDKLYSTYYFNDNKLYFLECINPDEFDGKLKEKELTIENNKVTITNADNRYEINDGNLSGAGFICPTYKNFTN